MKRVTARRTHAESKWYLNTEIVEEISQQRRKRDGGRKGNRTERVRRVERVTHPSVERTYLLSSSLWLCLELRISAPGSHTGGASHPIITLKWLLPHQWRTGRLALQWSSACFTALFTFPKLASQSTLCVFVNENSICQIVVTFCVSGSNATPLARTLRHSFVC